MLAKMWKKVLLAVCIIACIFNLMSKLVNRHSLESNLKSANDGNTVLDAIKNESTTETLEQNYMVEQQESINNEENNYIEDEENSIISEESNEEKENFKYSDFTVIF